VRPNIQREIAALMATDGTILTGIETVIARLEADADTRERAAEAALRTLGA